MADTTQTSGAEPGAPNGAANGAAEPAEKQPSLREIAEAAYDEITTEADGAPEGAAADPAQPRDERGRFASKDAATGEQPPAAEAGTQPREDAGQKPPEPTQPPQGASSEPPANWPQAAREMFSKQTPEAQAFLLERHTAMEGDYQRRVQQIRGAAEFTEALRPIFTDPVIASSLQQFGMAPNQAIAEWAGFHRRLVSPRVEDRVHVLFELAARSGLDPAVFATGRPGPQGSTPQLSEADLKDPAIKFFADHVGRTSNEVQALRAELQHMQRAEQDKASAEAMRVTRWGIDNFADEKGPDGKPLRPDFDQLLDTIIELFKANPNRDIKEAYETARWVNPASRANLIAAERQAEARKASDQRAAQAARSNVRGLTAPVAKPAADPGKPKTLRETIEESASEIGF